MAIFTVFVGWTLATIYFPEFAPGYSTTPYVVAAIAAAFGLAGSILAHELGHSLVAVRRGVAIDGITLWLLGGVARLKGEMTSPRDAAAIAAAGPAVSILLALIAGLATLLSVVAEAPPLLSAWLFYIGVVNAMLALFNLIPALPLDGGRILAAYKWHRGGDRELATVAASKWGRAFGFVLIGGGAYVLFTGGNGLFTMLIGVFLVAQAGAERKRAERAIARRNRPAVPPIAVLLRQLFPAPVGPVGVPTPPTTASPIETVELRRLPGEQS